MGLLPHAGSWFGLPDFGLTEKIQSILAPNQPTTSQGGSNLSGFIGAPTQAQAPSPTPAQTVNLNNLPTWAPSGGSGFGSSLASSIAPQSSGGAPGGATGPSNLDILRSQFDNARSNIQALEPGLDTTYNTGKSDIENAINDATTAAANQKDTLNKQFGDVLAQQLQTYKDLGNQRRGVYSGLGTLDSSSYSDAQSRADEDLANQESQTNLNKTNSLKSVDDQLTSYTNTANNQLANLASQYQAGKQQLTNALAQNNTSEASAIQQEMDYISQTAQQVQANMQNWATQAAILKSQGIDVTNALKGITGNDYASNVANQLSQATAYGNSLIPKLLTQPEGQGYISKSSGKRYQSYADALAAGDA